MARRHAHRSMDGFDEADGYEGGRAAVAGSSSRASDGLSTPEQSDSSEEGENYGSDSDDELPVEEFAPDEQETDDTTARQHFEEGRDLQGIPWERLQVTREEYRQQRLQRYRNYMNCIPEDGCASVRAELTAGWQQPSVLAPSQWPYAFVRNWHAVASSIVHFQLRNLLWAGSAHDVCVVFDNRVQHWSSATRRVSDVLDLRGAPKGPRLPGVGRVQVSTMCVEGSLLAAGGFTGELVLADMSRSEEGPAWQDDQDEEQEDQEDDRDLAQEQQDWGQEGAHQQQQQQQQQLMQQAVGAAQQLYQGAQLADSRQLFQQQTAVQLPHQQHQIQQQQQRQQQQQQQQQHCQQPAATEGQQPPSWPGSQQHSQPSQQQPRKQQQPSEVLLGAAGPSAARVLHCCRVTQSENGITNGIEIFNSCNYGHCVMTSNNDCCVRLFDVEGCRPRQRLVFPFAVNYATLRPAGAAPGGGAVAAVVGDDPLTWLIDCRSGLEVMKLQGHRDYSFAAAWHPAGHLLATGNQDSTTRVWDVRQTSEPLAVLAGTMGTIRSLRFSPDGAFLAAAEPADFVHIYDVHGGFHDVQEIDLFGEVAGISFSPDSQSFFVTISDTLYNSLVQYQRAHGDVWASLGL